MSWFSRRKEEQRDILKTLLDIESKKAEMRGNLELRRLELEAETYEARARVDQEIREMKAEQRRRGKEQGLKNAQKKRRANGQFPAKSTGCELCDDPQTRNVSIEMIKAHRLHEGAYEIPPTNGGGPEIPGELGN